jgi:hypothetical protein
MGLTGAVKVIEIDPSDPVAEFSVGTSGAPRTSDSEEPDQAPFALVDSSEPTRVMARTWKIKLSSLLRPLIVADLGDAGKSAEVIHVDPPLVE